MNRRTKLVSAGVGGALLIGGGAAFAATQLDTPQAESQAVINAGGIPFLFGGFGHRGPFGGFGLFEDAATYLGVTEAQLRTDIDAGKTLADVAKARGKSVSGLVDALVAAQKQRLDAAVAAGRL